MALYFAILTINDLGQIIRPGYYISAGHPGLKCIQGAHTRQSYWLLHFISLSLEVFSKEINFPSIRATCLQCRPDCSSIVL